MCGALKKESRMTKRQAKKICDFVAWLGREIEKESRMLMSCRVSQMDGREDALIVFKGIKKAVEKLLK